MSSEFFNLHLKSGSSIKIVRAERCVIDADNDYVCVSAEIDGEMISAEIGTTRFTALPILSRSVKVTFSV